MTSRTCTLLSQASLIFFLPSLIACLPDQPSVTPKVGEAIKTERLIESFISNANTPNPEDSWIYETDSAVWILEAALNYTLGNLQLKIFNPLVDTIRFDIAVSVENEVSRQEVGRLYREFLQINGTSLASGEALRLINVSITHIKGRLQFLLVRYSGYQQKSELNSDFGPDDNYLWQTTSGTAGSCTCYLSTQMDVPCGDKQIQMRINQALFVGVPPGTPTNIVEWTINTTAGGTYASLIEDHPNLNDATTNDQILDYMVFKYFCYNQDPLTPDCSVVGDGDANCLSPEELSFYTRSGYELIYEIRDHSFPTLVPLNVEINGNLEVGPWAAYHHEWVITYGYVKPVM